MEEKESYLLITRYLSQQTTTEENERLTDWIASSPLNEETFYAIKTVWQESENVSRANSQSALQKLKLKQAALTQKSSKRTTAFKWYAVAASLIGIMLVFGMSYQYYFLKDADAYQHQVTKAGQKKVFKLEDGTIVHLAPLSTLIYPVQMGKTKRIVELKGEAYFEVSKNPHRPFVVHTAELDVQVLGTHFNVKSYKSNNLTTVSLLEGKVKVILGGEDQDDYLLAPGQQLSLNHLSHRVYQHAFDVAAVTGWMTNTLVFKNDRLADAAEKMEKIYGIKVVFADQATADTRLYASFENETLINVLETIKAAGNVAYKITGNKVYLTLE